MLQVISYEFQAPEILRKLFSKVHCLGSVCLLFFCALGLYIRSQSAAQDQLILWTREIFLRGFLGSKIFNKYFTILSQSHSYDPLKASLLAIIVLNTTKYLTEAF